MSAPDGLRDAVASPPSLSRLKSALDSPSADDRLVGVREAVRSNLPAAAGLLSAVVRRRGENSRVKAGAALGLGRLGAKEEVDALEFALEDESPEVRAAAALSLGELRRPGVASALERTLLRDAHWRPRLAAAISLGRLGNGFETPALIDALKSDLDSRVRGQAARALGELKDRRGVQALMESFLDEDPAVRAAIGLALADAAVPSAPQTLATALRRENDPAARVLLALALRRCSQRAPTTESSQRASLGR